MLARGAAGAQTRTTTDQASTGAAPIDQTTQTEDVKYKSDAAERMTVPVLLSGTGPYRFLVDTGADRTAISREIASSLGLPPGKPPPSTASRACRRSRPRWCRRSS